MDDEKIDQSEKCLNLIIIRWRFLFAKDVNQTFNNYPFIFLNHYRQINV